MEQPSELQLEVARAKGIPAGLAGRLVGETEQELSDDADAMIQATRRSGREQGLAEARRRFGSSAGGAGSTDPLTGREQGDAEARRRFGTKDASAMQSVVINGQAF